MRWSVLCLMLLLAPLPCAAYSVNVDSLQAYADSLIDVRIAALEKRWKIRFDPALRPRMVVGNPWHEEYMRSREFLGIYFPDSLVIALVLPDSGQAWPNLEIFDHELVHAYSDQKSRQLGHDIWPSLALMNRSTPAEFAALRLQCEGIATAATVSREGLAFSKWRQYLPGEPSDCIIGGTVGSSFTYFGGRMMIQQLLDHVSLEMVVSYVVTHPVKITNRSFHADLVAWVKQARRDLGIKSRYQ